VDSNESKPHQQLSWEDIAQGLAEMGDALMALSVLVKDHRANLDWHSAGDGQRLTQEAIVNASSGSHTSNACPG